MTHFRPVRQFVNGARERLAAAGDPGEGSTEAAPGVRAGAGSAAGAAGQAFDFGVAAAEVVALIGGVAAGGIGRIEPGEIADGGAELGGFGAGDAAVAFGGGEAGFKLGPARRIPIEARAARWGRVAMWIGALALVWIAWQVT